MGFLAVQAMILARPRTVQADLYPTWRPQPDMGPCKACGSLFILGVAGLCLDWASENP